MNLAKCISFFRPNVTNIVNVANTPVPNATDLALVGLVKSVIKNSQGLARRRILASVETLRSAVKDPPA